MPNTTPISSHHQIDVLLSNLNCGDFIEFLYEPNPTTLFYKYIYDIKTYAVAAANAAIGSFVQIQNTNNLKKTQATILGIKILNNKSGAYYEGGGGELFTAEFGVFYFSSLITNVTMIIPYPYKSLLNI